jgi:hypothetical protein
MLDIQATSVQFPVETRYWYCLLTHRLIPVLTQPHIQYTEVFSLEVKWVRHDANHSPKSFPKVKKEWSYMSVPTIRLHGMHFYLHLRLHVLCFGTVLPTSWFWIHELFKINFCVYDKTLYLFWNFLIYRNIAATYTEISQLHTQKPTAKLHNIVVKWKYSWPCAYHHGM